MPGTKTYCRLLQLLAGLLFGNAALCQELPKDCINAINVCKQVYNFDKIYLGEGLNRNEINSSYSCLKRGENNSLWMIVKVQTDGDLGFLITPGTPIDIDWAVYNISNSPCSRISIDKNIEVSCNFSDTAYFSAEKGKTGATGATGNTHGDMYSSPYNSKIPVRAGEIYVIAIVTWWTLSNTGFSIDFGLSSADIYDSSSPAITSISSNICGGNEIRIKFSKYIDCSTIDASDFTVSGPGEPYQSVSITSENCTIASFGSDDEFVLKINPPISAKGNYKLAVTANYSDICGIANVLPEEIGFAVNDMPVVITSDKLEVCMGENIRLFADIDGNPPFKYEWFPGQFLSCTDCPSPKATVFEKTVFRVKVTDATGCIAEASIVIDVKPSPVISIIKGDTSICQSGAALLEIAAPGISSPVVSWAPDSSLNASDILNPIATPEETTVYSVKLTDPATGCSTEKEITVYIGKPVQPVLTLNGKSSAAEICEGSVATLDAGSKDQLSGEEYKTYKWSKDGRLITDSVRQFLNIDSPGSYSVEVEAIGGCKGNSWIEITYIQIAETTYEYPPTVCTGGSFIIRANVDGNQDDFSIKWLVTDGFIGPDNAWDPEIALAKEGIYLYIAEITDKTTLCRKLDSVSIQALPGITLSLGADIDACPGERVVIKANISGGGSGFGYKWLPPDIIIPDKSDSSVAEIITYEPLMVIVEASNNGGCRSIDTIMVNIPLPFAELSIPPAEFNPKQRDVMIPVLFNAESDLLRCKPGFALLKLEWGFSLFNPRKAFAKGREVNIQRDFRQSTRTWEISVLIPDSLLSAPGNVIVEILGDAMIGETDTTSLNIKSVQWDNFKVNNKLNPGFLRITDLCETGGKRLIDYKGAFYIGSMAPVPADEFVDIELKSDTKQDYYLIKVFNFFGNIIDEIIILKPGDTELKRIFTGDYSPGIYKIAVTAKETSRFRDLLIFR